MEKKNSIGKSIVTVFVVLILTVVLFVAYIFIRMATTKVENDNLEEILQAQSLSLDERVTVDDDKNLNIKLDKGDFYYVINSLYGMNSLDKAIEELGNSSGLKIENYRFDIVKGEPTITVAGKYSGIRLVGGVVLKGETKDNEITFKVDKIKIAGMSIPASLFKQLDDVKASIKLDTYILKEINEVKGENENLVLVGPFNDELLKGLDPSQGYDKSFIYYLSDYREVLDAGLVYSDDVNKATDIFLDGIKENGFGKVMDDYFSVNYPASSYNLMKNELLKERILSEYKDENFIKKYRPASDLADSGKKRVSSLTDTAYKYFNLDRLSIKDGKFYLDGEEFKYENFIFEGWEDEFKKLLKGETFKLVLIDDDKAFKGDVGPLSKHIDSKDSLSEDVDISQKYTCGLICETSGGLKIIAYNIKTSGKIGFDSRVFDLDENTYNELFNSAKVSIYHAK